MTNLIPKKIEFQSGEDYLILDDEDDLPQLTIIENNYHEVPSSKAAVFTISSITELKEIIDSLTKLHNDWIDFFFEGLDAELKEKYSEIYKKI